MFRWNNRKPKKRVVPTYPGLGMSLTARNSLTVAQERKVLESMVRDLREDRARRSRAHA